MFKCNLAASGNVSMSQAPSADQVVDNVGGFFCNLVDVIKGIDRRAQKFFNTQASVRGRKIEKPKCGWNRYDGFN